MPKNNFSELDIKCINTIRMLAVDAVEKANSGHPGAPMGLAPLAHVLWSRFLKNNPKNPGWQNRDRFILSAGHASMLLYSLLHLTGYELSLEDLKNFRQWGSKTPGHPEYGHTPGVETTTGPLGQGFVNGVGMAVAQKFLANYFNRPGYNIIDHFIYAIVSDGDLMEGVTSEAASYAGSLKLGNLIYFYDSNNITIEGSTNLTFCEDVGKRFEAYGWQVIKISDGNIALEEMAAAIGKAQEETSKPSLIIVPTLIACGSPHKQGSAESHGAALGKDEVTETKKNLGWPTEPLFYVPDEVRSFYEQTLKEGEREEEEWENLFNEYEKEYPELVKDWKGMFSGDLPPDWEKSLPKFDGGQATRVVSGTILNALAPKMKNLIGGSADLAPSNNSYLKGMGDFIPGKLEGRNLHFGIREHAMGSILNGMAVYGGIIPYGATFLVFSDYMRPAIRLAAIMKLRVIYIFTHDSIGLGEDGPTHQPIEHLVSLRAIPNLQVIRPADAHETAWAWKIALEKKDGPTAIILTRQKLPLIDQSKYSPAQGVARGAYILAEAEGNRPKTILMASGSEVDLALKARTKLQAEGIPTRVVSFPSWELFEAQSKEYKSQVIPNDVPVRLAIEAGREQGWHKYTGDHGGIMGIEHFGASAPGEIIFEKFGFTVENVLKRVKELM